MHGFLKVDCRKGQVDARVGRVLLNKNSIGAVLLTTLCADWAGLGRSEEALVGAYFLDYFIKC